MDGWSTYPVELKGGLITNLSPLQHGINEPGSARVLRNYEPSTEGGYRRIKGYEKYDNATIPPYGDPVVQGSGQSGTNLQLANIYITPQVGDTFTIAGVTGTYTIAGGGITYNSANKTVDLTLTTSLDSSPADKAAITFTNTSDLITGVKYYNSGVIAVRNADYFYSTGSGWTRINTPSYGTVLIDGAAQTGTSLVVDGIATDSTPQVGDTFTINSVEKVYTIVSAVTVTSGSATFTITPALDSSPADNASVTFLSTDTSGGIIARFDEFNDNVSNTFLAIVNGTTAPIVYNGTTFELLYNAPADVLGAAHVQDYQDHLFYAKGKTLTFTAPFNYKDFSIANGAGSISLPSTITGLIVFRQQLIVFCEDEIHRVVGTSVADFQLLEITDDIGCIADGTVQEIGGDIMFLGPDGLRLLSATDRIGDFGIASVSRKIQPTFIDFDNTSNSYSSLVIRKKSQYRLLGYNAGFTKENAKGIIATQFSQQGGNEIDFAETRGINAYCCDSTYTGVNEFVLFANTEGYVYRLENNNSFDGENIPTTFATPHLPITDPRKRKTYYKIVAYIDPEGSVNFDLATVLDFDGAGIIQPQTISINNDTDPVSFYGTAIYGVGSYGGKLSFAFIKQLVGSSFNVSFVFRSNSADPPYTLDALTVEFEENDRR